MRTLENNYLQPGESRIFCPYCQSKLAITAADLRPQDEHTVAVCECCRKEFRVLSDEELFAAFRKK